MNGENITYRYRVLREGNFVIYNYVDKLILGKRVK